MHLNNDFGLVSTANQNLFLFCLQFRWLIHLITIKIWRELTNKPVKEIIAEILNEQVRDFGIKLRKKYKIQNNDSNVT